MPPRRPYIITSRKSNKDDSQVAVPYYSSAFSNTFNPSGFDTPADIILRIIKERNLEQLSVDLLLSGTLNSAPRTDLPEMDDARKKVKNFIYKALQKAADEHYRSNSNQGVPWPVELSQYTPAQVLYSLLRCFRGRAEYAALAEKETSNFIGYVVEKSGGTFYDITAQSNKSVNQPGPDGLFVGANKAFGLAKEYSGLEVKTVVSSGSLASVLKTLKKRYDDDPRDFQRKTIEHAQNRLSKIKGPAAENIKLKISSLKPSQVVTMLVVRECGLATIKPASWVYQAFDLVLFFDAFNQIKWEHSRGVKPGLRAGISQINSDFLTHRVVNYLRQSVFHDPHMPLRGW